MVSEELVLDLIEKQPGLSGLGIERRLGRGTGLHTVALERKGKIVWRNGWYINQEDINP